MNAFLESVAVWLADFFVLASVLLAVSLALRIVVRGAAARVTLVWCTWLGIAAIALLAAVPSWPRIGIRQITMPPAVVTPGGRESMAKGTPPRVEPLPPLTPDPFATAFEFGPLEQTVQAMPTVPAVATPQLDSPITTPVVPWTTILATAWLASVALGLAWILLGHFRTRRLLTTAKTAPNWVRGELESLVQDIKPKAKQRPRSNSPGLWSSDRIVTAVAMIARDPQIVLPQASVVETNRSAIRAALAHEWAHIRHGDLWLLALERALLPLLAVHPLFWWLRRSVRLDQELLADAAAAGEEPVAYAEALVAWARSAEAKRTSLARHGLAAVGLWEHPSTLSRRVAMLVDSQRPLARPLGRGWTAILMTTIAALVLGLSLVSLRPLTAQEESTSPADITEDAELAPPKIVREYREVPRPVPKGPTTIPITQIHMNLIVMSVDRAKLDAADTSLEDEIATATESRCRKEAGLVVSEIKTEEVTALVEALKKHNALSIESRPSIVTLDGREANLHVGGEAPILRIEETINGKHEERVEYKEFGTILMVRPKLDANEKEAFVRLDIVAEQSTLLPPGEKAAEGAVPRNVPGLVSHKFKLTSDVKLGSSLLVAESPPSKKQLRDGVKKQFLLIVTPQQAVRSVVGVDADPREGEKAQAARKDAEAALSAATAAEPEPGTGAAALLKRERELRAKETADLRQQIEALNDDLQKLRAAAGLKVMSRVFPVKSRKAENIAADLQKLFATTPAKDRVKITVEAEGGSILIQADEPLMLECQKLILALDRSGPDIDPKDPNAEHVRKVWKLLAERREHAAGPIVELKDDVQYFRPGSSELTKSWEVRAFRLKLMTAEAAKKRFLALYSKSPLATQKIVANFSDDLVEVHAPAELMEEVRKLLEPLGVEEIARTTRAADPAAATKVTKVFRLRHTEAIPVIQKIGQMMKQEAAGDVTLVPEGGSNAVIVSAPEPYFKEIEQVIQMLDKPADPAAKDDARPGSRADVNRKLLELELAAAKLEVEKAEKDFARIQQVDVSQAEVDAARIALATAQIQVQKAMARLEGGAPASAPAADPDRAPVSRATEVKLLELDLAEAKLTLEAAESDLARIQQLRDRNVVSEEEVSRKQLAAERAKIHVQRIMVRLEAAKGPDEARRR